MPCRNATSTNGWGCLPKLNRFSTKFLLPSVPRWQKRKKNARKRPRPKRRNTSGTLRRETPNNRRRTRAIEAMRMRNSSNHLPSPTMGQNGMHVHCARPWTRRLWPRIGPKFTRWHPICGGWRKRSGPNAAGPVFSLLQPLPRFWAVAPESTGIMRGCRRNLREHGGKPLKPKQRPSGNWGQKNGLPPNGGKPSAHGKRHKPLRKTGAPFPSFMRRKGSTAKPPTLRTNGV